MNNENSSLFLYDNINAMTCQITGVKKDAKGIVEIDNTMKIIFQEDAKKLKRYIDELNEE